MEKSADDPAYAFVLKRKYQYLDIFTDYYLFLQIHIHQASAKTNIRVRRPEERAKFHTHGFSPIHFVF